MTSKSTFFLTFIENVDFAKIDVFPAGNCYSMCCARTAALQGGSEKPKWMPTEVFLQQLMHCVNPAKARKKQTKIVPKPNQGPPKTSPNRGLGRSWEPWCTQEQPRSTQRCPKGAQERRKGGQEPPKSAQNTSKTHPKDDQTLPKSTLASAKAPLACGLRQDACSKGPKIDFWLFFALCAESPHAFHIGFYHTKRVPAILPMNRVHAFKNLEKSSPGPSKTLPWATQHPPKSSSKRFKTHKKRPKATRNAARHRKSAQDAFKSEKCANMAPTWFQHEAISSPFWRILASPKHVQAVC